MQACRITPARLRTRFHAIAIVASLSCVPAVHATAYFVATNGNDSANGLSPSTPFHTIAHAVSVVGPGDSIDVRAGTYVESVVISRAGTAAAPIQLRAYPGEAPLLRGTGPAPTVYFYHPDCDEDVIGSGSGNIDCHPMHWIVQGLTLQGSPAGGDDGYVVKIDTPQVRLQRNRLCCSKVDIVKLVRTANDVEIRDNEIWQNADIVTPGANAQGIDIVGADRTHVVANFVHDVPDIGIYAKGNARNTLMERNRLLRIGGPDNGNALMLGQSTDADRLTDGNYETYDGIVRNNVVVDATYACLATSSSSNARFYNNSCHDTARTGQASIYLSNESEIGTPGSGLVFVNNVIDGNAARPVLKIGSDAMGDYSTLVFARNLFHVPGGTPQFYASDFFDPVGFAQWQSAFLQLTGHAETGFVADPVFLATDGEMPLAIGSDSPAVDAGDAAAAWVPDDYTGRPRPSGNAFDIGAFELAGDMLFCDAFEGVAC